MSKYLNRRKQARGSLIIGSIYKELIFGSHIRIQMCSLIVGVKGWNDDMHISMPSPYSSSVLKLGLCICGLCCLHTHCIICSQKVDTHVCICYVVYAYAARACMHIVLCTFKKQTTVYVDLCSLCTRICDFMQVLRRVFAGLYSSTWFMPSKTIHVCGGCLNSQYFMS